MRYTRGVVAMLKQIRKAKGMTLAQVAERAGILPEAVARAERAGVDARFSTVVAIASALGAPLCELTQDGGDHGRRRAKR